MKSDTSEEKNFGVANLMWRFTYYVTTDADVEYTKCAILYQGSTTVTAPLFFCVWTEKDKRTQGYAAYNRL